MARSILKKLRQFKKMTQAQEKGLKNTKSWPLPSLPKDLEHSYIERVKESGKAGVNLEELKELIDFYKNKCTAERKKRRY